METSRTYVIGDAELTATIFEGEILQVDEVNTTHVHGEGGGGSIAQGSGNMSNMRIYSTTETETKVWVSRNGKEAQWTLPGAFPFRPGHKIAVCDVSNGNKIVTCLVKNVTMGKQWITTGEKGQQIFKFFTINKWFRGTLFLLLAGLSIAATPLTLLGFLAKGDRILLTLYISILICTAFSYRSVRNRGKRNVEAIGNMINDMSKIMPST